MGSLDGVRVLDLSRLLPGPACSWYLRGLGARIDRVEPPGTGDPTRALPPFIDGVSAFYTALNAGDRSLALDLRRPGAAQVLCRLAPHYDVLIEGFKPGVLEAAGVGPSVLSAAHPGLVIARVSGWGQDGPWAQRPGHDLNYQGLAGLVASQPLSGNAPAMPGFQAADLAGALVAALGIVAALVERTRNNRGKVLDVSLAESALSLHHPHITSLTAEGRTARPGGELLTGALPVYGTYRCADGQYLTVGALEPKFQAALAAEVGVPSRAALVGAFGQESRDVWVERLEQACVAPVLTATELADHPHWAARKSLVRLGQASFVRPPFAPASWSPGPVAKVGEHGRDILLEAGFSKSETQSLVESRVVAGPWTSS